MLLEKYNNDDDILPSDEVDKRFKENKVRFKLQEKDKKIQETLEKSLNIDFNSNENIIDWLRDLQLETHCENFSPIKDEEKQKVTKLFEDNWYNVSKQINTWNDFKKYDSDNYTKYLLSLWISNLNEHWLPGIPEYMINEWKSIHWKDTKLYNKLLKKIKNI